MPKKGRPIQVSSGIGSAGFLTLYTIMAAALVLAVPILLLFR